MCNNILAQIVKLITCDVTVLFWSVFTCKSLKGCRRSPRGSRALLSKAWVCGRLVSVHLKVLRNTEKGEVK